MPEAVNSDGYSMFARIARADPLKPADVYFDAPYLFEFEAVLDQDERNALVATLLAMLYEHRLSRGHQQALIHMVVLEEAHTIMPGPGQGKSEQRVSSPAEEAASMLARFLAEMRQLGQGVTVVEQSVSKLIMDVLVNCGTKIAHGVLYGPDRQALADSMPLWATQAEHLSKLDRGHCAVSLPNCPEPFHAIVQRRAASDGRDPAEGRRTSARSKRESVEQPV